MSIGINNIYTLTTVPISIYIFYVNIQVTFYMNAIAAFIYDDPPIILIATVSPWMSMTHLFLCLFILPA